MSMSRMVAMFLALLLGASSGVWAGLCGKCADNMYTADIGQCVECGGHTSSGAFKLCGACSTKLGQCAHCRQGLAPAKAAPQAAEQGLTGKVHKLKGNFMPGPGGPPAGRATIPLVVPIHVFRGQVKPFEKPNPKHPALVRIIKSDKEGGFKVALPPGQYTVVAEIDGKLYLNSFDGQGFWSSVQVAAGQWATWNIADTSEAAF